MLMTPSCYKRTYSDKISGTEVNYYLLCKRRCWLVRHRIMITESNPDIVKGRVLSRRKRSGHAEVHIGRNKLDIVRNTDGELEVHEYKKAKDTFDSSRMQLLHYLQCLEEFGATATGVLHALGSKTVEKIHLDQTKRDTLREIYREILRLDSEKIPQLKERPICHTGCSFEEYCWG